jgi:hypothetical protein
MRCRTAPLLLRREGQPEAPSQVAELEAEVERLKVRLSEFTA